MGVCVTVITVKYKNAAHALSVCVCVCVFWGGVLGRRAPLFLAKYKYLLNVKLTG